MGTTRSLWLSDIRRMLPIGRGPLGKFAIMLGNQGIWAVTVFRFGAWLGELPRLVRLIANIVYRPVAKVIQCLSGIDIPTSARIGRGLYIGHFGGIILHSDTVMGEYCNLSQQVTIGIAGFGDQRGVPVIGNRVYLGPGAKVIGPVHLGDGCIVGANAVVTSSFPPGSIIGGVPGKLIRQATSEEIQQMIFGAQAAEYSNLVMIENKSSAGHSVDS